MPRAALREYCGCQTDGDGARSATEVEDTLTGLEMGEQVRCVGVRAATMEKLEELLAVAHRVVLLCACVVGHG